MEAGRFSFGEMVVSVTAPGKWRTFIGFVAAGGAATVVNYSIFASLYWAGMFYLVASAIGYVAGIAVSFVINRRLVFRSSGSKAKEVPRYVLAYLAALAVQLLLLEVLVRLGLDPLIANAVALAIVVVLNFFVIRRVVFRSEPQT